MKLIDHSGDNWCYQFNPHEAGLLRGLLNQFPICPAAPGRISRTDAGPAEAGLSIVGRF